MNAQNQIRVAEYQRCSQLHMPDYRKTLSRLIACRLANLKSIRMQ